MRDDVFYVAVCGPAEASAEEEAAAETVGRAVARAGGIVVCGGLSGVMEGAARGAEAEGGVSIGILPGPTRKGANPHLTAAVPTAMGEARNALVVRAADAVIAIGGAFGTLSEIALALKIGVPVVGLGTWELARSGEAVDVIERATDAEDAVKRALAALEERGPSRP